METSYLRRYLSDSPEIKVSRSGQARKIPTSMKPETSLTSKEEKFVGSE